MRLSLNVTGNRHQYKLLIAALFFRKKSEPKKQNAPTAAINMRPDNREAKIMTEHVCNHFIPTQADLPPVYQQVINTLSGMSLKPLWARN